VTDAMQTFRRYVSSRETYNKTSHTVLHSTRCSCPTPGTHDEIFHFEFLKLRDMFEIFQDFFLNVVKCSVTCSFWKHD